MKIIDESYNLKNVSIILGFFDGIHCGHRAVINNAVNYAREINTKTLLITFKESPAKYFTNDFNYIYSRKTSYKLIESLGVDYLLELDFEKTVQVSAQDFLDLIIKKYTPRSITTGYNYTYGLNKKGNADTLKVSESKSNFKYFCVPAQKMDDTTISSTLVKELLSKGKIELANKYLCSNFTIESEVISGKKIGRKIGFPTANMIYPQNIVKIPFGVYKVSLLNQIGIMNWGIKPTFNNIEPLIEIHIPNFNDDLYGKKLEFKILKKIRDEKKFDNIESLIKQINEDIDKCLES